MEKLPPEMREALVVAMCCTLIVILMVTIGAVTLRVLGVF